MRTILQKALTAGIAALTAWHECPCSASIGHACERLESLCSVTAAGLLQFLELALFGVLPGCQTLLALGEAVLRAGRWFVRTWRARVQSLSPMAGAIMASTATNPMFQLSVAVTDWPGLSSDQDLQLVPR